MAREFRLPGIRDRVSIMGRTGSGKTVLATWLLSRAPFETMPYIILDYKGDDLLNSIDRVRELGLNELPKHPGLYIMHPRPDQGAAVEAMLWAVWAREGIGLYLDEAYMVPDKGALQSLLTQGRSKRIPIIGVTQRPVEINRFLISEADYFSIFHLHDARDVERVRSFMPRDAFGEKLPEFFSRWYDVKQDRLFTLKPVPSETEILDVLDRRLAPKNKVI